MDSKTAEMKKLLLKKLPRQGVVFTGLDNMAIFRRDQPYNKKPELTHPHIMILAQGKKRVHQGEKTYIYDPLHYYVQTLTLPLECEAIIEEDEPILGMVLRIDPVIIGEILFEMQTTPYRQKPVRDSLYDASITDDILDAAIRLLRTLDSEDDLKILGPMFYKEILFKILKGEKGEILRELAVNNRGFYHIAKVINRIQENYSDPIDIQSLAREAGMSVTAFHANFKAMTNTSPLQYVKNIRLHKAKEMIQQEGEKANTAAQRVGYESSSQFSREYKRCFGIPPSKDRLQDSA